MAAAPTSTLRWIRKRDQTLVPFHQERLEWALARAARTADLALGTEAVRELAAMVAFTAARASDDGTMSSAELADWIVKSLENTGHRELATAFRRRAEERERFRAVAEVVFSPSRSQRWEKAWLRNLLESRTTLPADAAAEVARETEWILVSSGLHRLPIELVCAVATAVMREHGWPERLQPPGQVWMPAPLDVPPVWASPDQFVWDIAQRVCQENALADQLSPEIAQMHAQGRLQLLGPWIPGQLSGIALDLITLARHAQSAGHFLAQLGRLVGQARSLAAHLLALDLVDVAIAMVAGSEEEAYQLGDALWAELQAGVGSAPCDWVVNLYGRVPLRAYPEVAPGPLFRAAPDEGLSARVEAAASAIMERFLESGEDSPLLTVDYHWAPTDPARLPRSASTALRALVTGRQLRIAFDRYVYTPGDGLYGPPNPASLLAAELNLLDIFEESGAEIDEKLDELVEPYCDALVRVAVQKREQLRQRLAITHPLANLLGQAALVLCPVGLDALVREFVGVGIAEHPTGTACAMAIVHRLRRTLDRLASPYSLPTRLDRSTPKPSLRLHPETGDDPQYVLPGLTSWAPGRGLREQIHRVGQLHRAARAGTLVIPTPIPPPWSTEQIAETLNWAYETSSIIRLQFLPIDPESLWDDEPH